jgi:hypothetical protein
MPISNSQTGLKARGAENTMLNSSFVFLNEEVETRGLFGISNLGHCDLFGICDL